MAWLVERVFGNKGEVVSSGVKLIPHAAELLNDYYWRLATGYLKPLLDVGEGEEDHNLHYYKIISASEITVMAVSPFGYTPHPRETLKEINAEFAWFVATSIFLNWKIESTADFLYDSVISVWASFGNKTRRPMKFIKEDPREKGE